MREEEIRLMPKMVFIVVSVIMYYFCLFLTGRYSKAKCRAGKKFFPL
ncbi:MAG: hypothetical protein IJK60_06415 [Clostridia bacterium]|nr:hypothetical protein [Clostridia bacterium]